MSTSRTADNNPITFMLEQMNARLAERIVPKSMPAPLMLPVCAAA